MRLASLSVLMDARLRQRTDVKSLAKIFTFLDNNLDARTAMAHMN